MTDASTFGSERCAVIGGGMLGMWLAHRLAKAGRSVTLFEAAPQLGGLASAWQLGDVTWDRHYHVIVPSDSYLRTLLVELGLDDQIQWVQTRVGFLVDGSMHSMSSAWEFLRFPPLNLFEKARLAATIAVGARLNQWEDLEWVPAEDWLRRWSGDSVTDRIWIPLLRSKLGDTYRRTSAAFIWGAIRRMDSARQKGSKKETFGYVPGGYAAILDRFRHRLEHEGVRIRLSHSARRIAPLATGEITAEFDNGHRETFDRAVLSMASPIAAHLCPDLQPDEIRRLEGVEYLGILCASVLLRQPLKGYYVTNLTDADLPFTGVIEMTALVDPSHFGGHTLVYLPKYAIASDPLFALTDEQLESLFIGALLRMYPHLRRDEVLGFRLSREKYVTPVPTLHYSRDLPAMQTSIPGLHVVNSSQIVNGALAVNTTLELGERAMRELLADSVRRGGAAVTG
jgi:protoporphyrinogen oxidase